MNIRKSIDYCEMFAALDHIIETEMPRMEQYYEIGKAVSRRTEKGAAVAAAEYMAKKYPDVQGFSPRNLRRMRDFYRAYEDQPALLSMAWQLGWTQNVVILEADLPMELCGWYLMAASQFGWSKAELVEKIAINAHEMIVLKTDEKVCDIEEKEETINHKEPVAFPSKENKNRYLFQRLRCQMKSMRGNRRRCPIRSFQIFVVGRIASAVISFANVLDFYCILCNTGYTSGAIWYNLRGNGLGAEPGAIPDGLEWCSNIFSGLP